jgi:hypothetical protein
MPHPRKPADARAELSPPVGPTMFVRGAAGWATEAVPAPEGVYHYVSPSGRFDEDVGILMSPDEALDVAFALLQAASFVATHAPAPGGALPATEA